MPPRVFISYAWEDESYKLRVKRFATRLREDGIDARLDLWHMGESRTIPEFMNSEVRNADRVLVLCSPAYRHKVHSMEDGSGISGVGCEMTLLTSRFWAQLDSRGKGIPVLFQGKWTDAAPDFLLAMERVDLSDDATFEQNYLELLRRITGKTETAPPLGRLRDGLDPDPVAPLRGPASSAATPQTADLIPALVKSRPGTSCVQALVPAGPPDPPKQHRISISKLPAVSPLLIGRETELALLDAAWANPAANVIQISASGGTGKTALIDKWFRTHVGEAPIFGWSFYSQGTSEERSQTSSDSFFAELLRWLGLNVDPTASVYAKAEALAERLRAERVLLLLDGLEPLQDASGEMKDAAMKALLAELGTANAGLVVCTTRARTTGLPDDPPRAQSILLENLTADAGAAYLEELGVRGWPEELRKASRDYGNHALALTLLGKYLVTFCDADVRRCVEIPEFAVHQLGKPAQHARRMIAAYEEALRGTTEIEVLKALGYFDRPAEKPALDLVAPPGLSPLDYKAALARLRDLRLVLPEDGSGALDCHPLIREHFAESATPKGHSQLYDYYSKQAPHRPDTEEAMRPLFYAIYHGCRAGRHVEARRDVYWDRVRRGSEAFLTKKLGAFGTDLSLLASFFATPWTKAANELSAVEHSWVIGQAAFALWKLGRLADAVEPMGASAEGAAQEEDWKNAAIRRSNLSELLLTLGHTQEAIAAAQQAVEFADRSGEQFLRIVALTAMADALHKSGDRVGAAASFVEAEKIQVMDQPQLPLLYSLPGYRYCDLLLGQGNSAEARRRATQTLAWAQPRQFILDVALDHLTLARAGDPAHLTAAIEGLRRAGQLDALPLGLLARGTQHDLDEVFRIATRSSMKLHLTDAHLAQAHLHLRDGRRAQARTHFDKADRLVTETGYHRRDPELAELRAALE